MASVERTSKSELPFRSTSAWMHPPCNNTWFRVPTGTMGALHWGSLDRRGLLLLWCDVWRLEPWQVGSHHLRWGHNWWPADQSHHHWQRVEIFNVGVSQHFKQKYMFLCIISMLQHPSHLAFLPYWPWQWSCWWYYEEDSLQMCPCQHPPPPFQIQSSFLSVPARPLPTSIASTSLLLALLPGKLSLMPCRRLLWVWLALTAYTVSTHWSMATSRHPVSPNSLG